jgi:hypothetical protein
MSAPELGVNMAESLDDRESVQVALEDVEHTLVAASTRLAQVQLDTMDDTEVSGPAADAMNALSPIIESIQTVRASYVMETNHLANEGKLD